METLKKGLNGYTLKILALIFMTFDHIAYFVLPYNNVSLVFHWIGRISAPLFIFMVAEGFYHTSNRKKYIWRLYGWSVLMAIGNNILNTVLPHPEGKIIFNNIFATMFLITVYLMAIEWIKKGRREKNGKWIGLGVGVAALPMILTVIVFSIMGIGSTLLMKVIITFLPTPMLVEGSIIIIGMGIGFYLCRHSKKALGIFYSVFCAGYFYMMASAGFSYENLFVLNYQWMMIGSLPFILFYNGEKGKSMKHLFYVYYPVHCYILYAIGVFLALKK